MRTLSLLSLAFPLVLALPLLSGGQLAAASATSKFGHTSCPGASNTMSAEGAQLWATGTSRISRRNLTLRLSGIPPKEFGRLIAARGGQAAVELPFGDGNLCLDEGAGILRLPVFRANSAGNVAAPVDFDSKEFPSKLFRPGSTWAFQAMYRDSEGGEAGFNLSSALEITFTP